MPRVPPAQRARSCWPAARRAVDAARGRASTATTLADDAAGSPAQDESLFAGFASAVGDGPLILSLHALVGTLLPITAVTALIRSRRLGAPPPIALTTIALVAIVAAWLSGSEFVGHMQNGSSLAMALATALAILCYALVIFLLGIEPRSPSTRPEQPEAA